LALLSTLHFTNSVSLHAGLVAIGCAQAETAGSVGTLMGVSEKRELSADNQFLTQQCHGSRHASRYLYCETLSVLVSLVAECVGRGPGGRNTGRPGEPPGGAECAHRTLASPSDHGPPVP
jgi:hypothetical protein